MSDKRERIVGHILALISTMVWGSTFIFTKLLLEAFTPIQLLVIRYVIAYIAGCIAAPRFFKPTKDEWTFLLLGITACSLYTWLENTAVNLTQASNVSIIITTSPLFIAILAHFFTRDEKLSKKSAMGSVVALAGVALVVFNGSAVLNLKPAGDLLALAAALCWAIYSLLAKGIVGKYDGFVMTRKVIFYGLITSIPLMLLEHKPFNFSALFDFKMAFCMLALPLLGSNLCNVLWHGAMKRIGIVAANTYLYLIPFFTVGLAALVLDERITWMAMLGAVLIIAGLVLASRRGVQVEVPSEELTPEQLKSLRDISAKRDEAEKGSDG